MASLLFLRAVKYARSSVPFPTHAQKARMNGAREL
jgi:hypothetical protein